MSLNVTPFTELHRTVLDCAQLAVSTADLVSGFPILAPNGTLGAPSYSFASNTDTGLLRTADGVLAGVDAEAGLVAAAASNVALGSVPSDYGGGAGVVFLSDAVVDPVGVPNAGSGGILYVAGATLNFLDAAGTSVSLTTAGGSDVTGPESSTTDQLLRFSTTTGRVVTNCDTTYTSGQLLTGDGALTAPAYSFSSESSTGMYVAGTTLNFSGLGVRALSLNSASATFGVPLTSSFTGSAATPEFSFTSSVSSGILYDSNHLQLSSGGDVGLAVGGASTRNVSLAGAVPSYGANADGVLFIPTASTDPVGVPNGGSGGVLYATSGGTQLRWLDASGNSVLLGGSVDSVSSSVDGQLAVWTNTTGSAVAARPVISDAGAVHAVQDANLDNPAYSFTASGNTGMLLSSAGTLAFQATTDQCVTVNSQAVSVCAPVLFPDGSASAPAYSFSASTNTGAYSNASDAFKTTAGGNTSWAVRADNNLVLGAGTSGFGSGEGIVNILYASVLPTTAPSSAGLLYTSADNLLFRDTSNTEHTLTSTSAVLREASSTDTGVVRFDTTDGKVIQDTSTIIIPDTGEVRVVGSEGYSFTSSATSGLVAGGADTLSLVSAGTTSLTLTSASATVAAAHVLTGMDGSAGTPSFSFSSGATSGVYLSGTNTVGGANGGVHALSVDADQNVALGSDTPDFAGGQGVVYISDVGTLPTTTLSNGGLLYMNGGELYFYDQDSTLYQLSGVQALGSSTDLRIATFTDTLGRQFGESGFSLSGSNQITGVDGSSAAPTYRVGSSGTVGWWYAGANVVEMGNGAAQLSLSSTAVTAAVQVEVDASLRIGGNMTETFSAPGTTRNVADADGSFVWQQNGTPIFQTNSAEDVDLLSNFAVCTGGTGDFSIGHDGTRFDLNVANAADTLDFAVGGTPIATFSTADITCENLVSSSFRAGNFTFTAATTTGLSTSQQILVNGTTVATTPSGAVLTLFGAIKYGSIGTRVMAMGKADVAPTTAPTSGVYLYADTNASFMRVANKDVDVAINGPLARAKISRTQTIASGALDLIDTLTDVESNILVVDTASPGAGTITGTADTAGWWEISANALWDTNSTGRRRLQIKVGGVVVGESVQAAVSGMDTDQQVRVCVPVAASAVVTFEVEQDSGGNLDVDVIGTVVFMG